MKNLSYKAYYFGTGGTKVMALITCPDCGSEISDSMNNSPHCNYSKKEV